MKISGLGEQVRGHASSRRLVPVAQMMEADA
jgi:hypothetical protein